MAKELDYSREIQSRYYVHFQTNILGKGIKPLSPPPNMDLLLAIMPFKDAFGIE